MGRHHMDQAETERVEAGRRLAKEFPSDVERMLRELRKEGVTSTELEVATLWGEFSQWFVALWLHLPRSNRELRHILLRGLRLRQKSDLDWALKCLEEYQPAYGRCSPVPVRWDLNPDEFDAAAYRLMGTTWGDISREEVCQLVAQKAFIGHLRTEYPGFADDLAKVQLVASAYWLYGRQGADGYPR